MNRPEQFKDLISQSEMIDRSIKWWEEEMDRFFAKLKKLPKRIPERQRQQLLREGRALIGKGELEIKNMYQWCEKKDKFNEENEN